MIGVLLILSACETERYSFTSVPPEASHIESKSKSFDSPILPPPARDLNRATGSRVQFKNVAGYLARRSDETGGLAIVLQGDSLDPNDQYRARQLADTPALVFLISADMNVDAAREYVEKMEGITQVQINRIESEAPLSP